MSGKEEEDGDETSAQPPEDPYLNIVRKIADLLIKDKNSPVYGNKTRTPLQLLKALFPAVDKTHVLNIHKKLKEGRIREAKIKNEAITAAFGRLPDVKEVRDEANKGEIMNAFNRGVRHARYPIPGRVDLPDNGTLVSLLFRRAGYAVTQRVGEKLDPQSIEEMEGAYRDLKVIEEQGWLDMLEQHHKSLYWCYTAYCLMATGRKKEAARVFNLLRQYKTVAPGMEKLLTDTAEAEMLGYFKECKRLWRDPVKPELLEEHERYPGLDSRLDVEVIRREGPKTKDDHDIGVVAREPVMCSEIVALQRQPLAHIGFFFCCYHCLKIMENLLPCPGCTVAAFCSVECRDLEMSSGCHRFECGIGFFVLQEEMSNTDNLSSFFARSVTLPVRIILRLTPKNIKRYQDLLLTTPSLQRAKSKGTDDPWIAFWNMNHKTGFPHESGKGKATLPKHQLYTLISAVHVIKVLQKCNNFFKDLSPSQMDMVYEAVIHTVGACRLNTILTSYPKYLQVNSIQHEVGKPINYMPMALGIFPSIALFKHSCVPNVEPLLLGSTIGLVALRYLKPGEQLTVNWIRLAGFESYKVPLFRGTLLPEIFLLECRCQACDRDLHAGSEAFNEEMSSLRGKIRSSGVDEGYNALYRAELRCVKRGDVEGALGCARVRMMLVHSCLDSAEERDMLNLRWYSNEFTAHLILKHWAKMSVFRQDQEKSQEATSSVSTARASSKVTSSKTTTSSKASDFPATTTAATNTEATATSSKPTTTAKGTAAKKSVSAVSAPSQNLHLTKETQIDSSGAATGTKDKEQTVQQKQRKLSTVAKETWDLSNPDDNDEPVHSFASFHGTAATLEEAMEMAKDHLASLSEFVEAAQDPTMDPDVLTNMFTKTGAVLTEAAFEDPTAAFCLTDESSLVHATALPNSNAEGASKDSTAATKDAATKDSPPHCATTAETAATTEAGAAALASPRTIRLRMREPGGTELQIRVSPNIDFVLIKKLFADKCGCNSSRIRFKVRGSEVDDADTPDSAGLVDGDVIVVEVVADGGRMFRRASRRWAKRK